MAVAVIVEPMEERLIDKKREGIVGVVAVAVIRIAAVSPDLIAVVVVAGVAV
jgi:hypothetical protein